MLNGSRSFGEGYDILLRKIRARYGAPRKGTNTHLLNDDSIFIDTHEPTKEAYEEVQRQVRILLDDVVASLKRLSAPRSSNIEAVGKLVEFYCAVDRAEQRLIEGTIEAIAGAHPEYVVIKNDNCIPVTKEAYRFVQDNAHMNLGGVRLHYSGKKKHDYKPSAIFVNVKSNTAYLVDYKRTRSDVELRNCQLDLQSARIVLPYWLHDRCNGMHIRNTSVSIVSDKKHLEHMEYLEETLYHLDHVLYVRGAELMVDQVRTQFAASVKVLAR